MKYRVICTDPAGWPDNDRLWGHDYQNPEDREFATEAQARKVCAELTSYDYAGTVDLDAGEDPADYQPEFAVETIEG